MSYTQMITLRMCVLKMLMSLWKNWTKYEEYFLNGFRTIFSKSNTDKYHLNLSMDETFSINIDNEAIKNSIYKKMLGFILNKRLGFDTHVTNICNRVSKDLHT